MVIGSMVRHTYDEHAKRAEVHGTSLDRIFYADPTFD